MLFRSAYEKCMNFYASTLLTRIVFGDEANVMAPTRTRLNQTLNSFPVSCRISRLERRLDLCRKPIVDRVDYVYQSELVDRLFYRKAV